MTLQRCLMVQPLATSPNIWTRLYVEAVGGVAGDMLLAAFIDIGADLAAIQTAIASVGAPQLRLTVSDVTVQGEHAKHVHSVPPDNTAPARHLEEILGILARAEATTRAHRFAHDIYTTLAHAEAKSHADTLHHVHLHEVGQLDSILDVLGIAVAYDSLGAPPLGVGPLPSGRGTVQTTHGLLTVPVPAVVHLAQAAGIVLTSADLDGETLTPTGAAALIALDGEFNATKHGTAARVGVGAGTRRFPNVPNVVRIHGYTA